MDSSVARHRCGVYLARQSSLIAILPKLAPKPGSNDLKSRRERRVILCDKPLLT